MSLTSHAPSITHLLPTPPGLLSDSNGSADEVMAEPEAQGAHAARSSATVVPSPRGAQDAGAHHNAPKPSILLATPEARRILQVLREGGMDNPTVAQLAETHSKVQNNQAFQDLVKDSKLALMGEGPGPSPAAWTSAQRSVWGSGDPGRSLALRNTTAFVFLTMLEAQREALKEKQDVMMLMRMHADMLDDLNSWLTREIITAQRKLNKKIKDGTLKDSITKRMKQRKDRSDRMEELVGMPQDVDTQWGAIDPATGKYVIPGLSHDAVVPTKVDAQDLTALISQADQWRTTLQNHQSRDTLDFKRIDDTMSSAWIQLNSFLKSAQEGTNSIIRNGFG